MKCDEHSLGVLILHHTGGMKKRLIVAMGGRLQRALLLLQRLHTMHAETAKTINQT